MATWTPDWIEKRLPPTMEEMQAVQEHVDRFIEFYRHRDLKVARWALQEAADGLGIPTVATRSDPLGRVFDLGHNWVTAAMTAGWDPGKRGALVRLVRQQIRDLLEVFGAWKDQP